MSISLNTQQQQQHHRTQYQKDLSNLHKSLIMKSNSINNLSAFMHSPNNLDQQFQNNNTNNNNNKNNNSNSNNNNNAPSPNTSNLIKKFLGEINSPQSNTNNNHFNDDFANQEDLDFDTAYSMLMTGDDEMNFNSNNINNNNNDNNDQISVPSPNTLLNSLISTPPPSIAQLNIPSSNFNSPNNIPINSNINTNTNTTNNVSLNLPNLSLFPQQPTSSSLLLNLPLSPLTNLNSIPKTPTNLFEQFLVKSPANSNSPNNTSTNTNSQNNNNNIDISKLFEQHRNEILNRPISIYQSPKNNQNQFDNQQNQNQNQNQQQYSLNASNSNSQIPVSPNTRNILYSFNSLSNNLINNNDTVNANANANINNNNANTNINNANNNYNQNNNQAPKNNAKGNGNGNGNGLPGSRYELLSITETSVIESFLDSIANDQSLNNLSKHWSTIDPIQSQSQSQSKSQYQQQEQNIPLNKIIKNDNVINGFDGMTKNYNSEIHGRKKKSRRISSSVDTQNNNNNKNNHTGNNNDNNKISSVSSSNTSTSTSPLMSEYNYKSHNNTHNHHYHQNQNRSSNAGYIDTSSTATSITSSREPSLDSFRDSDNAGITRKVSSKRGRKPKRKLPVDDETAENGSGQEVDKKPADSTCTTNAQKKKILLSETEKKMNHTSSEQKRRAVIKDVFENLNDIVQLNFNEEEKRKALIGKNGTQRKKLSKFTVMNQAVIELNRLIDINQKLKILAE